VPPRAIALWEARVSTTGAVTFTDRRQFTRAAGGVRRSIRDTSRAGSHQGDLRISELASSSDAELAPVLYDEGASA